MQKSKYKLLNCSRLNSSYVYDVLNFSYLEVQKFTTEELLTLYNTEGTLIENLKVHTLLGQQYISPMVRVRYHSLLTKVIPIGTHSDIAIYLECRSGFLNIYFISKKGAFKQLYSTNVPKNGLSTIRVPYVDEIPTIKSRKEVAILLGIDLVQSKITQKMWVLICFTTKGVLKKIEVSSLESSEDIRKPMVTSTSKGVVKISF